MLPVQDPKQLKADREAWTEALRSLLSSWEIAQMAHANLPVVANARPPRSIVGTGLEWSEGNLGDLL
jgi:hypothetical protein